MALGEVLEEEEATYSSPVRAHVSKIAGNARGRKLLEQALLRYANVKRVSFAYIRSILPPHLVSIDTCAYLSAASAKSGRDNGKEAVGGGAVEGEEEGAGGREGGGESWGCRMRAAREEVVRLLRKIAALVQNFKSV
jgi:hypothetical protein